MSTILTAPPALALPADFPPENHHTVPPESEKLVRAVEAILDQYGDEVEGSAVFRAIMSFGSAANASAEFKKLRDELEALGDDAATAPSGHHDAVAAATALAAAMDYTVEAVNPSEFPEDFADGSLSVCERDTRTIRVRRDRPLATRALSTYYLICQETALRLNVGIRSGPDSVGPMGAFADMTFRLGAMMLLDALTPGGVDRSDIARRHDRMAMMASSSVIPQSATAMCVTASSVGAAALVAYLSGRAPEVSAGTVSAVLTTAWTTMTEGLMLILREGGNVASLLRQALGGQDDLEVVDVKDAIFNGRGQHGKKDDIVS